MNRRYLLLVLVCLLVLVLPVCAGWYDTNWNYRKEITVNNAGSALADYQIQFTVNRSSGSDSGSTVYLNGKCQDDYDDIRFTKADGTTPLDYWIESSTSTVATIWVEFDSLPNGNTQAYLYYGNPSASSASDGDATFPFFDDFTGSALDTGKWEVRSDVAGTISVANSTLTVTVPNSDNKNTGIRSLQSFDSHTQFVARVVSNSNRVYGPLAKQDPPWYGDATSQFEIYGQYGGPDSEFGLRVNSATSPVGIQPSDPYLLIVSWDNAAVRVQTSTGQDSGWKAASSLVSPHKIAIFARDVPTTSGGSFSIDYLFARYYVPNEPSVSAWGRETPNNVELYPSFSALPLSGNVPLLVTFADSSTSVNATINTWQWSFGDGSGNSTQQNPQHQYVTSGLYDVILTITNTSFSLTNSTKKTGYINVTVNPDAPNADFTVTETCGETTDTFYFIDFSTGGGLYAWNWSFGDGSYSELRNPTHQYAGNGTYDVNLTVWGAYGVDSLLRSNLITIPCGAPTPTPTPTGTGTPTPTGTPGGNITEGNITYIYAPDQDYVPFPIWLAIVVVTIALFGHSIIFLRNSDLTAMMAAVFAFISAWLSNMIGFIEVQVTYVSEEILISPVIQAVHPPWLVYTMLLFALVSVVNIFAAIYKVYLKPTPWNEIYNRKLPKWRNR